MKRTLLVITATLICGACLLTSCKKDETSGIAMIVKNGQIDYWRQVESAFRAACQERGLTDHYYATSAENAYQEQVAAVKNVYTFDVYGEFIDELRTNNSCLKGVMAQNTFVMTRKAVEAVIANANSGEMIPTFYITSDNLNDENVLPFLEFYHRTNNNTNK